MTDPRSTDPRSGPVGVSPRAPNQPAPRNNTSWMVAALIALGRAGRRGLEYARSRRSGRGQSRAPDDGTKQSGAGRLACDHSLSQ